MTVFKAILDACFWIFHEGAFWVFALAAIGGALLVVISQNVVRMAFWLIVSLGATAGLFFSLNADFVGAAKRPDNVERAFVALIQRNDLLVGQLLLCKIADGF